jgi:hypothetical protein
MGNSLHPQPEAVFWSWESSWNVVEADESRFKRHANVGRLLRAGWFFGLAKRLTED